MAIELREETYLGQEAFVIENEYLLVRVLKKLGAKIASIYHKPMGFELLHQPVLSEYKLPENIGGETYQKLDFSAFDTSGLDDCFPSIDACSFSFEGREYHIPDHGDVWFREAEFKWQEHKISKGLCRYDLDEDEKLYALEASFRLDCMPFLFKRQICVYKEGIYLDYEITNLWETDLPSLWALHGLCKIEKDMELVLPEGNLEDVRPQDAYRLDDFDPLILSEYPQDAMIKFYLEHPIDRGHAEMHYTRQNVRVEYRWKAKDIPYLGVWATTGGFKNEKNIAFEPSTGFYDSLDLAISKNKYALIKKGEQKQHGLAIHFWPLRTF